MPNDVSARADRMSEEDPRSHGRWSLFKGM